MAIAMVVGVSAQKAGYDPVNAPFGHGQDSVNCRLNLSLMQTSAKAEAYESALKPWMDAYENCPAASKNIYIYGPRIFKALYGTTTDEAKKKEYLDKTMDIYETRLIYFGQDDAKGTILAYKTYDYMELMGEKTDQAVVYQWLGEAVNDKKGLNPLELILITWWSMNLYLSDNSKKEQYLNDYFAVVGYVDQAIALAKNANDQASADYLVMVKDGIVKGFVVVPVTATLTEHYADKVEPNKTNKEFLNEVINALASVGCSETDFYFTVAEYLYQLEPSAGAAIGLANKSLKDKDYETALKYYEQAANLETDKNKASDYMMQLAGIFANQRNFAKARQAANEALSFNPSNGEAYILIAQLYASSANKFSLNPRKQV